MVSSKYVAALIERFKNIYPQPKCALHFTSPLQLLIATILSAQCTDERVNKVTPGLFKQYPDAISYAKADIHELEDKIRSTGFFRNKASNIHRCCQLLVDRHQGKVPSSMVELTALPGVARKTANVVLGNGFGIAEGIVVDTHVLRLSLRLGLSREKQPEKIEKDLMAVVQRDYWIDFAHWLILHGRAVCTARKPDCPNCQLSDICPREGLS